MNEDKRKEVILQTLDNINKKIDDEPNALIHKVNDKGCWPEAAYCELVQNILKLLD